MKTLNQLINDYSRHLQEDNIQIAYKGILDFIGSLRSDFINKYPDDGIGNIYQGYMDMSYFPVSPKLLKEKGLKIAVVYLHEKGAFEVWLSARNREILRKYKAILENKGTDHINLFHDESNEDAAIECTLISVPDFDNQALLMEKIEQGTEKFISIISELL
jgi:hypothetical protein